jgi:Holliday junction DNA helicase RuvB
MAVFMTATTITKNCLGDVYPGDWDDFIGQERAKRQLQIACASARMRKVPLDHVLLDSGEHGVGKTALGLLCGSEIGKGLKPVSGPITINEARIALSDMERGDVLLWDEFHLAVAGGRAKAEWLLNFLQDGVLLGPLGPEEVPHVTVIACTTEPGRLPETITSRFLIRPTLTGYDEEEATMIALTMLPRLFEWLPLPNDQDCREVAQAANCNPREIRKILINVRDIALFPPGLSNYEPSTKRYNIAEALDWLGITPDGLDRTMQRYLVALKTKFAGGAGKVPLMEALHEPGGLGHYERILQKKGYIAMTKQGRLLLGPGVRRATELQTLGVTV